MAFFAKLARPFAVLRFKSFTAKAAKERPRSSLRKHRWLKTTTLAEDSQSHQFSPAKCAFPQNHLTENKRLA
jgi:hypothetical protein